MKFSDFGFKKFINDGLDKKDFITPTKVQEEVIPLFKKHQNVVAQAHTGTGKTYAFLLPILNNIDYSIKNEVQALIIAPTRELATQIEQETRYFKQFNNDINTSLFVGGTDNEKTKTQLEKSQPTIAIGTPEKINELYKENLLKITTAKWIVVDEFDMIFDLGFFDDLDNIMAKVNRDSVKALFSATFSQQLKPFIKKYIPHQIYVDQTDDEKINGNVENILVDTKNREDKEALQAIVKSINPYVCIIFVNNKDKIGEVVNWLREFGISSIGEIHGDLEPRTRAAMFKRIKNNEYKYIVATDIAARGIDLEGVSHVISIDLPKDLDYYVHRSGRTGRNGESGQSYVLFNNHNQQKIDYLRSQGVNFTLAKVKNGELFFINRNKRKRNKKHVTDVEEQKIIGKYKNNHGKHVKPGYKKKRKEEIATLKRHRKRQHIQDSINRIKKERYRKRQHDVFGKDE